MRSIYFSSIAAATYNCDTYGSGSYSNQEACLAATTTTQPTATPQTNPLAKTGFDVAVGLGSGLLLVVASVVILARLRKSKKK
ncbi:MAG: hypothetical protein WAU02_03565 [Candidatus Saccharimonadales bacterium]